MYCGTKKQCRKWVKKSKYFDIKSYLVQHFHIKIVDGKAALILFILFTSQYSLVFHFPQKSITKSWSLDDVLIYCQGIFPLIFYAYCNVKHILVFSLWCLQVRPNFSSFAKFIKTGQKLNMCLGFLKQNYMWFSILGGLKASLKNSMARSINNTSSTGQKQIKYYNISDLDLVFGCLRTN